MRQARHHPTIARPRRGPAEKASEQAARLARTIGMPHAARASNCTKPLQAQAQDARGPGPRSYVRSRPARPARRSSTEMNAITTAAARAPSQQQHHSQPGGHHQGGGRERGKRQAGTLAAKVTFMAPGARAMRMTTTAGAIRLTTARASFPASAASQPGIRRTRIAGQAAGGQVHRFPQARRAAAGPGSGQQHAEHLLPVDLAMARRVAGQQAPASASFQDCRPGRGP